MFLQNLSEVIDRWEPRMSTLNESTKALWVALSVVFALVTGIGAGVLAWMGGQRPATAVLIGGSAFGGTLGVALMVLNALG
jgi:hypothetical protein